MHGVLTITQALALTGDDSPNADADWTFSEVTGIAADLFDADNAAILDLADKVTLSANATAVAIADAITLAGLALALIRSLALLAMIQSMALSAPIR